MVQLLNALTVNGIYLLSVLIIGNLMLSLQQLEKRINETLAQIASIDKVGEPLEKQVREYRTERRRLREALDRDYDRIKLLRLKIDRHPDRRTISLLGPDDADISGSNDKQD